MYGDRRFQTDYYFPFILFNQQQIKNSSKGGYLLTERKNYRDVARKVLDIDMNALETLIERGKGGLLVRPETDDERACFELLSLIDHVAGHVDGSNTVKKYQRNECKSLIIAYGAPMWFITFAPVDFKHLICLYYCGIKIDLTTFYPSRPEYIDCLREISKNPVACARFFHVMVTTFIKSVIRPDGTGFYGNTSAYYGTVE
ncbi:hypothetical protein NEOLEDRAFT_1050152, partial [Neolentinus lepideus HHB14362 ss-1]